MPLYRADWTRLSLSATVRRDRDIAGRRAPAHRVIASALPYAREFDTDSLLDHVLILVDAGWGSTRPCSRWTCHRGPGPWARA